MDINLSEFLNLSEAEQAQYARGKSILFAQQFTREDLDFHCRLANASRFIHARDEGADFMSQLLRNKVCLNFFIQPSSRTFLSFNTAQTYLGMKRMSVRDLKISSVSKGESLADSIRTFISYVDLVVMRHPDEHAGAASFWVSEKAHRRIKVGGEEVAIPIISGGSGTKQHPTQALLDIYTLEDAFKNVGGIDGKTLMLVGDLKRGRTVRSLSYLMKNYQDVKLLFAAPDKYQMGEDICEFLDQHGIQYAKIESIEKGLAEADGIYMTRIQDEWDDLAPTSGHVKANENFIFKEAFLDKMKPHCCLMHPLPKRDEIEESIDYVDDPRVYYWRQERNGMWMRVAIIAELFKVADQIIDKAIEMGFKG
ncbi:MAG: aspartate carbamoyltransferase [Lentisphaeria bacterium]|nr:aspartate carbamoyltransferase [Lentisphaeria bacterium]